MKIFSKGLCFVVCLFLLFTSCGCSFFSGNLAFLGNKNTDGASQSSDSDGETAPPIAADGTTAAVSPSETALDPEVERILSEMSLEDKVAQMFVVTPDALTDFSGSQTETDEQTKMSFDQYPVGGIIYLGENLLSTEQTKTMLSAMQEISKERTGLKAFLCVDEEGGEVARISGTGRFDGVGSYRTMSAIGAEEDAEAVYAIGSEIGAYLSALGFNVDFAPVADVLTNEDNTVVKYRSFGSDPKLVAEMTGAFARGLMSSEVLATYKHFPGHGATSEDSHYGFAISNQTKEELLSVDLVPFIDGIDSGVPFIMSGHIRLPNITDDDLPASLSKEILTGILREELGYDGIIITDAMNMGAITDNYSVSDAAVMAVEAGNDMLLLASDLDACYNAVLDAVETGRIPEKRIDESIRRIVRTKIQYLGIIYG